MRAGIRSRPWAGLDVGSFSVKLMAAQGGVGQPRVWTAEAPYPDALPGAEESRSPEIVARTIAACMELAGFTPRSFRGVTMGISGADVIIKQIQLPLLDEDEIGPALRFEARKHLPFDPQAMVLDYQVLGRYLSDRKTELLLAAVSQEHLQRHLAPLELLDLTVDIVDATPLALTNALAHDTGQDARGHLLLDVGHRASHLTLYQRGEPYFSRRLEFGGHDLTRAIAERLEIPLAEAEEWKLDAGSERPGLRVEWDSRELQAVAECLQRDLVDELRRSFAFYRTLGRLPDPLRLRLSGGSARLPGIADRLTEMLGIPVSVFNPLDEPEGGGRGGPAASGPQFAQAYGLALRSA